MPPPGQLTGGRITAGKGALALGIQVTPSPILVAKDLQNYGNGIKSFKDPLRKAIREVMAPSFQKNFDEEGRPAWADLAEYTINEKERLGYSGKKILERTGNLRRVVGQLNIWEIEGGYGKKDGRAFVKELPGAEYGGIHQTGSRGQIFRRLPGNVQQILRERSLGGRGDIPPRPFLQFQPEDRPKIERIFENWHDERARRHMRLRGGR